MSSLSKSPETEPPIKREKLMDDADGEKPGQEGRGDDSESEVSDEEDDDLNLEGVLVRNSDVSDSSSDEEEEDDDAKQPADTKGEDSKASNKSKSGTKRKRNRNKPKIDVTMVDFTFWDMREKFFHGIKALLHSSSSVYAAQSSSLSDLMIDNVSVGTVISTEGDEEGNVFGFASILNVKTNGSENCIKFLKKFCLDKCPAQHRSEMETVLSGKTARPAGILLHSRMVNMPLEIVEVLHQQLVLDMDWAVKNAEGGEVERKSLDFGAFVRIAPAASGDHGSVLYKYFEDEIFATNAEFSYAVDAPKSYGQDVKQLCSVIVMTKTGHRAAMEGIRKLVGTTESA